MDKTFPTTDEWTYNPLPTNFKTVEGVKGCKLKEVKIARSNVSHAILVRWGVDRTIECWRAGE